MPTYIASTLKRGESQQGAFAVAEEQDLKLSRITVADLSERDNLPSWKLTSKMEVKVISEDKIYELQSDLTTWTDVTVNIPSNVVTEDEIFDGDGFIQSNLIKNLFINDAFIVADQAAMLATTSVIGNVFILTNTSEVFIKLNNDDPADISDFADITANTGNVLSVNGQTGAVNLTLAGLLAVQANLDEFQSQVSSSPSVSSNTSAISTLQSDITSINDTLNTLQSNEGKTFVIYDTNDPYSLGDFILYQKVNGSKALFEVIQNTTAGQTPEDNDGSSFFKEIGDYYTKSELDSALALKADLINGKIPISQIPTSILGIQIVDTITDRDALSLFEGLRVIVLDASDDPNITSGSAEYVYDSDHPNADLVGFVLIPGSNASFTPDTSGDGTKFLGDNSTVYKYVKGIYKPVNLTSHGFAVNDVLSLNGANYVLSTNTTLTPIGIIVEVIDANNFLLWVDGYTNKFSGLTPDTKYYIGNDGKLTTTDTGRFIIQTVSSTEAYFSKAGSADEIAREDLTTGVLEGFNISVNGVDPATFDISSGKALIVDNTVNPTIVTVIEYSGSTNNSVINLATENNTDLAINSSGAIVQRGGAGFTNAEFRTLVPIGGLDHNDNVQIENTFSFCTLSYNIGNQLRDLAQAVGDVNLNGNFFSANGTNLQIDYTGGQIYAYSENRTVNINSPNIVNVSNEIGVTFLSIRNDGSGSAIVNSTATIDPNFYDDGNNLVAVPQNDWQIKKLYIFPNSGTKIVQYGEAVYKTKEEALDNITKEVITVLDGFTTAFLRGFLVVKEGTTDLSDLDQAEFRSAGKFGNLQESTGSGSTVNDDTFQAIKGPSVQAVFKETDDLFIRRATTGIYYGGDITIDVGNTTFTLTAGQGVISGRNDNINPTFSSVAWSQKNNFALNLANPITFIYFDDNTDTLKTTIAFPTLQNRNDRIYIAAFFSDGSELVDFVYIKDWVGQDSQQLGAIFDFLGEGKNSGGIVTPNGANLSINISNLDKFDPRAGTSIKNPHSISITYSTPVSVQHINRNGNLIGAETTTLDVNNYDANGDLTPDALPSNDWQVMQIWAIKDNIAVLYGQQTYGSKADAENSIVNFSPILPLVLDGGVRLAYLIVKEGATVLNDTNVADFRGTNKFGEFGGGAGSLTGTLFASNNLSDVTSEDLSLVNLLEANGTQGTITHSVDGTLTLDYNNIREITLTLDANITTLSFTNLPVNSKYIPVILRIEQNATTGYSIATVSNLENGQGINPPLYSTVANENTEWYIYSTSTGIRIDAVPNVT